MMKKVYLYLGLAVCAVGAAVGIASTAPQYQTHPVPIPPRSKSTPQTDAPQPFPSELPEVKSNVPGVTLERVRFNDTEDDPPDFLEFDIVNNTDKSILSVTIRSGRYSQTYNAHGDEAFIFPGYKSVEGRFALRDIVKNSGVTLTGVQFTDGEMLGTDYDKELFLRDRREKAEGKGPPPLPAHLRAFKAGGVKQ
jgi:hypothetical protein